MSGRYTASATLGRLRLGFVAESSAVRAEMLLADRVSRVQSQRSQSGAMHVSDVHLLIDLDTACVEHSLMRRAEAEDVLGDVRTCVGAAKRTNVSAFGHVAGWDRERLPANLAGTFVQPPHRTRHLGAADDPSDDSARRVRLGVPCRKVRRWDVRRGFVSGQADEPKDPKQAAILANAALVADAR
jgi:hypothetical protein